MLSVLERQEHKSDTRSICKRFCSTKLHTYTRKTILVPLNPNTLGEDLNTTYIHTYVLIYVCTYIQYVHTYVHLYYVHAHTYMHTSTYVRTYVGHACNALLYNGRRLAHHSDSCEYLSKETSCKCHFFCRSAQSFYNYLLQPVRYMNTIGAHKTKHMYNITTAQHKTITLNTL